MSCCRKNNLAAISCNIEAESPLLRFVVQRVVQKQIQNKSKCWRSGICRHAQFLSIARAPVPSRAFDVANALSPVAAAAAAYVYIRRCVYAELYCSVPKSNTPCTAALSTVYATNSANVLVHAVVILADSAYTAFASESNKNSFLPAGQAAVERSSSYVLLCNLNLP